MDFPSCLSVIKDIVIAVSAGFAVYVAYSGLDAWKRELKGRSEYKLSKDTLIAVYRVRNAFLHVRNPAIFTYEYPEDMRSPTGHLKDECKYEGVLYAYEERFKRVDEAFSNLEDCFLEAQVEWGSDSKDKIVKLRVCRSQLLQAVRQMLDGMKEGGSAHTRRKSGIDPIIYSSFESDDEGFNLQISEAINEFEKWLRPHVRH